MRRKFMIILALNDVIDKLPASGGSSISADSMARPKDCGVEAISRKEC
jgi:hypothetical protein